VEVSAGLSGWFPTVAADDAGHVHVVWQTNFPQDSKYPVGGLFYARGDGQGWTRPVDIGLITTQVALRTSLTIDGNGALHLIYKGFGQLDPSAVGPAGGIGQEELWYTTAPGLTAERVPSWRPTVQITHGKLGYYSDIGIDHHGVLHAIWTESIGGFYGLYYSHSLDGGVTWTGFTALEEVDPVWWYRAHLTVDSQDRLHVAWEVRDPRERPGALGVTIAARYAMSADGGQTWTKTTFATNTGPYPAGFGYEPGPQQPAIGVDGRGTILLIYRDFAANRIMYRVSPDGIRWGDPIPIPGVEAGVSRPYDIYDMITDSAGHVHLAMVGYPTGSSTMSLLHGEWDGEKWSDPSAIAESPPYPEYPKLALSNGNQLHVVWFNGDRPTIDRNQIGIWYSTATTTAPRSPGRLVPPTVSPVAPASPQTARPATVQPDLAAAPTMGEAASPWSANLLMTPLVAVAAGIIPIVILLVILVVARGSKA
jgi:hypothetical protein